ncbi:hypothetical protein C8R43DRAFT_1167842 [Mycena crocata]|nr:hypothetical protein C8R43DRAFT_1167842 [Mycena crocata]
MVSQGSPLSALLFLISAEEPRHQGCLCPLPNLLPHLWSSPCIHLPTLPNRSGSRHGIRTFSLVSPSLPQHEHEAHRHCMVAKASGKVQRQACRLITGGFRTTATDALDFHANMLPCVGAATSPASTVPPSTLFATFPIFQQGFESIDPRLEIKQAPTGSITTRIANEVHGDAGDDRCRYEGGIGAAAVVMREGIEGARRLLHLGEAEAHTVFESEVVGAIFALDLIASTPRLTSADVLPDCQPALLALASPKPQPGQPGSGYAHQHSSTPLYGQHSATPSQAQQPSPAHHHSTRRRIPQGRMRMQQDLYFYALASSPVSTSSAFLSSDGSGSCSSPDEDEEEGYEYDEDGDEDGEDEEDGGSSVCSDDGRGYEEEYEQDGEDARMVDVHHQVPSNAHAHPSRSNTDANAGRTAYTQHRPTVAPASVPSQHQQPQQRQTSTAADHARSPMRSARTRDVHVCAASRSPPFPRSRRSTPTRSRRAIPTG